MRVAAPRSGAVEMKRLTPFLILIPLVLFSLALTPPRAPQADDPYAVVAAVNEFRATRGMGPLTIDAALMAAAQAHSDYMASIRQVTHYGPGGSRPVDRAMAYGFGGGAKVFISENIAGGYNLTIQEAIYNYWQDELHLYTMLNPNAVYIGAGTGVAGDYVYYTVDAGYYSGAPAAGTTSGGGNNAAAPTVAAPPPNPNPVDPFIKSTPREDGALIHIVGYGQSLIGIVNTYGADLNEVLKLNNLTLDSVIYPGDEIIIRPSYTPTVTVTASPEPPTATPSITPTPKPQSPTPLPTLPPLATIVPSPTLSPTPLVISPQREPVVVGAVLTSLTILLVVILLGLRKRSP
ncbi:MAG: hypothetical protein D6803_08530 [Anaerolineae bacterium]|nr:MAG: hypothetical protein D6803_08530 [Anaerolineae bacterium]